MKNVVFGYVDGLNRRGKLSREWMDDIKEWCRADVQTLSIMAQDVRSGDELSWRYWTPTGSNPWNEEKEEWKW